MLEHVHIVACLRDSKVEIRFIRQLPQTIKYFDDTVTQKATIRKESVALVMLLVNVIRNNWQHCISGSRLTSLVHLLQYYTNLSQQITEGAWIAPCRRLSL